MKKKHHVYQTDEQIQHNRINFILSSREAAFGYIKREIMQVKDAEFHLVAYMPSDDTREPQLYQSSYCIVDVVHREGPHKYACRHPVNLSYPNKVYGALVRTILAVAKNGGSKCIPN